MTDLITTVNRALTAKEFQGLADVPPEVEWFANLGNATLGPIIFCVSMAEYS